MSYSIIFDTKFIKLSDGRLLHLNRSGCNNDTSGRDLSDYTGKIYTIFLLLINKIGGMKNVLHGFNGKYLQKITNIKYKEFF